MPTTNNIIEQIVKKYMPAYRSGEPGSTQDLINAILKLTDAKDAEWKEKCEAEFLRGFTSGENSGKRSESMHKVIEYHRRLQIEADALICDRIAKDSIDASTCAYEIREQLEQFNQK